MVAALVDDLLFRSKIQSVAERTGEAVRFFKGGVSLLDDLSAAAPRLVIVDLDRQPDASAIIAAIKADPRLAAAKVLGFVSHVHADAIAAARAAGADNVLARSAFVMQLATILAPAVEAGS